MLVSAPRYADNETRALARAFAEITGSFYCARGKKTIETLVSQARKKGERIIALLSGKEISFIFVSTSDWKWNNKSLKILDFKIHEEVECELGIFEGKDAPLFEALFGFDSLHGGEAILFAEKGKMKISDEEGKILLEMGYEIAEGNPHEE